MPRFTTSLAWSLIGVEHADVTLAEFVLHPRAFLTALRPACRHTDDEQDGDVRSSEGRTRQYRAYPMTDYCPNRKRGWRLGAFDALPNLFVKARRKRSVRAPFLKHLVKWLVVIAWVGGLHVTSTRAAEAAAQRTLLVGNGVATTI